MRPDKGAARVGDEVEAIECQVCGIVRAHEIALHKWGYTILRCRTCGLGSTVVDDDFDVSDIYNESYFGGGRRDGYADYLASEPIVRAEFQRALAHLVSSGCHSGRLLEIGCAFGFFLLEAQRYFRCTGIEVAPAAVTAARARGLNVYCGELTPEFLVQHSPFDVVAMFDVLEHLKHPAQTLGLVRDGLREGGWLILSTGDWESLCSRALGGWWRLMTPPQHLYFFSRWNLQHLLERLGFRIVDCVRPSKIVPFGLAAYQVARHLGLPFPRLSVLHKVGLSVNLFDVVRVVACRS